MDSIINIYILDNIYIQYCIMCVRYYVKISEMWFTRSSKLLGSLWITVCHEFFVLLCIHKSAESRLGSTAVERMVVKWCRAFCHSWPMASALIKELCVMMLGSTASDNLKAVANWTAPGLWGFKEIEMRGLLDVAWHILEQMTVVICCLS